MPGWLRILLPTVVLLVWFALFGAGGASFGQISAVSTNDAVQQLPASADATKVQLLQSDFRGSESVPGVVLFVRDGGLSDSDLTAIDERVSTLEKLDGVFSGSASPILISNDKAAAEVILPIDSNYTTATVVDEIRATLADQPIDGVTTFVTGPAGLLADLTGAFAGIDGILLLTALGAVFIILILVYRSPLLPLIVLGTSLSALCASVLVVVALARAGALTLTGQTQGILFILVIGAATDYSLLYVSRFREALRDKEHKWDATWTALRGSFEPILASGGTVIAALLCLLFSDLNTNKSLGPVAAIGIAFAIVAALTLLPALLLWAGRTAFWPVRPRFGSVHPALSGAGAKGIWPKLARVVSTRARLVWVASTLILLVASLGVFQLKADGISQSDFVLGASQARDGQAALGEHFPGGSGTPALVVGPQADLQKMADVLLSNDGVDSVSVLAKDSVSGTTPITTEGLQAVGPPGTPVAEPTVVNGEVMIQATLNAAGDSPAAEQTVRQLRVDVSEVNAGILVGGTTAIAIDTNDTAIRDRTLIIPIILVVILLILMLLLRAIVAPLLLMGTVVLSFGATLGVSAWVFNDVLRFPGADPVVPLYGFVFLVALGVDYNIFLMSRVREESIRHGTREGILRGLVATGGVITSAGVVLAATFAALGVLPILFLAQIAFIVAFGVLLDTFLVRSLLVPALAHDIGREMWWPSKLSRR
ncbi:efflux RND transporter permease subunit [Glaciibacter psychrotolerans]